ncbi:hypothetical protein C8238_08390 [Paracidovorax avenae]|nr:hypothetical protein C8238_08390 [Paracidovorax avenae]
MLIKRLCELLNSRLEQCGLLVSYETCQQAMNNFCIEGAPRFGSSSMQFLVKLRRNAERGAYVIVLLGHGPL